MHELSIIQSIVDAVVEHTGGARVCSVRLEIGALSGVEADALRFCFDAVTRGTPLDGAGLVIEPAAGLGRCGRCGADVPLSSFLDACPCGSVDVDVRSGQQLRILDVEVERDVRDLRM